MNPNPLNEVDAVADPMVQQQAFAATILGPILGKELAVSGVSCSLQSYCRAASLPLAPQASSPVGIPASAARSMPMPWHILRNLLPAGNFLL